MNWTLWFAIVVLFVVSGWLWKTARKVRQMARRVTRVQESLAKVDIKHGKNFYLTRDAIYELQEFDKRVMDVLWPPEDAPPVEEDEAPNEEPPLDG